MFNVIIISAIALTYTTSCGDGVKFDMTQESISLSKAHGMSNAVCTQSAVIEKTDEPQNNNTPAPISINQTAWLRDEEVSTNGYPGEV